VAQCVVSTDDDEIAEVAARDGAQVVRRPAELADDHASTGCVAQHLLETLLAAGLQPAVLLTLQPTCPLRPRSLVEDALELFQQHQPDSVVAVTRSTEKVGAIRGGTFVPEYRPGTRSQDLPERFFENGLVYVSAAPLVLRTGDLFGQRIVPLVTDLLFARGDIDTDLDFEIAEYLFQAYRHLFTYA
jgi:N-acylneuraminate cytidylyltransferase